MISPKHKDICNRILEGQPDYVAYAQVMGTKTERKAKEAVGQLLKRPEVKGYIEERQGLYQERELLTALQRRRYVINRLIVESGKATNKGSERIKALELLGKMHDVRLFTDALDVADAHNSPADIKREIMARLGRMTDGESSSDIIDLQPIETDPEED